LIIINVNAPHRDQLSKCHLNSKNRTVFDLIKCRITYMFQNILKFFDIILEANLFIKIDCKPSPFSFNDQSLGGLKIYTSYTIVGIDKL